MIDRPARTVPKLYLNHDVSATAGAALRKKGHDVVAAQKVGMEAASDEEHLIRAASEGRVIVSFNVEHYPLLHVKFLREGREHSGIVLSKQLGIKETIRALERFLTAYTAEQVHNQLWWL